MRDQQAALRMRGHGGQIVKQIVGMGQDDRADPFLAVVVSRVIQPHRTQRSMERAFARTGKQPDAAVAVARDAPQIVVGVRAGGLRFLARLPGVGGVFLGFNLHIADHLNPHRRTGGDFRFGTIHRQVLRPTPFLVAGERGRQ